MGEGKKYSAKFLTGRLYITVYLSSGLQVYMRVEGELILNNCMKTPDSTWVTSENRPFALLGTRNRPREVK